MSTVMSNRICWFTSHNYYVPMRIRNLTFYKLGFELERLEFIFDIPGAFYGLKIMVTFSPHV